MKYLFFLVSVTFSVTDARTNLRAVFKSGHTVGGNVAKLAQDAKGKPLVITAKTFGKYGDKDGTPLRNGLDGAAKNFLGDKVYEMTNAKLAKEADEKFEINGWPADIGKADKWNGHLVLVAHGSGDAAKFCGNAKVAGKETEKCLGDMRIMLKGKAYAGRLVDLFNEKKFPFDKLKSIDFFMCKNGGKFLDTFVDEMTALKVETKAEVNVEVRGPKFAITSDLTHDGKWLGFTSVNPDPKKPRIKQYYIKTEDKTKTIYAAYATQKVDLDTDKVTNKDDKGCCQCKTAADCFGFKQFKTVVKAVPKPPVVAQADKQGEKGEVNVQEPVVKDLTAQNLEVVQESF